MGTYFFTALPFPANLSLVTKLVPLADVTDADQRALLESLRGGAISIGNFDGVHRGHVSLLQQVRRQADRLGGPAIAVALDPHPAALLRPERAPPKLTTIAQRAELMDSIGIDALVVCDTRGPFLKLSADDFFDLLVRRSLGAKAVVEGPNFFFGRDRGGDIAKLESLCRDKDIDLHITDAASVDDQMISSTRIRKLLELGQVGPAGTLLGRPHRIVGQVVSGARRGRRIGFPTANLSGIEVVVPGIGVYGAKVQIDQAEHLAAVHIGPNPTFQSDDRVKVEVHVMDYDGDLYDQTLGVDIHLRVRDVIAFESADALIQQLGSDIQYIRNALA